MSNYDKSWGKFMENLTSPKKYYELTLDELVKLCKAYRSKCMWAGEGDGKLTVELWLKANIKDEA